VQDHLSLDEIFFNLFRCLTTTHIICCFLNALNFDKIFYKNEICNIETTISIEAL